MNIAQIATLVGQRLGIPTSDGTTRDGAACRAFIINRHDQLYRSFAWKDALIEYVLNITPSAPYTVTSNYLPTKGHVLLPSIFQHVMGVRFGHRPLRVEKPMIYYRVHYDRREWTREFYLLSSCVWEFDTVQTLSLANNSPSDTNQTVSVDLLQPDEVSILRSNVLLNYNNGANLPGTSDRIDNMVMPTLAGQVSLQVGMAGVPGNTNVFTLNAGVNSAPKCQRIKLMGTPCTSWTGNKNLHVLGKRNTPTFAADTDTPGVNGLDGILFALGYYDMALRDERGGSPDATAAMIEAVGPGFLTNGKPGGFLGKLIEEEVLQEAYSVRIIPEYGFGGGEHRGWWGDKDDIYESI